MKKIQDQMTSNERMAAYFEGKEVDRLPAMPMIDSVGPRLIGENYRFKKLSAENQVLVQKKAYELLGLDGLSIEYGLHGIGQACGTVLAENEKSAAHIAEHVLKDLKDVDNLDPDCVLRKNDPWIDLCCTACEMLVEQMGDVVGTSASLTGPLTAAASIYPIPLLLKATRKQPELVHKLLRFSTDALIAVSEEFAKCGVDIFICDPVASCEIISDKMYRELVLPYTKELAPAIHKYGVAMGYHICGNTNKITADMLESGCDMLSVDVKVPLLRAKELGGEKVPIIGNVDPINTMMLGTPDEVYKEVMRDIEDCADSPNGYIVSTGCDIPVDAPMDNIYAFMEAVREYGPARIGEKNSKEAAEYRVV
jgi:uroporphyrinogen decarboxylase